MGYYTIQNGSLLTADNEYALTRFYDNVYPLPIDYKEDKYIVVNDELVPNPDYEQIIQDRINNLTMTPLDFIKVLEGLGLTLMQINGFLEDNLDIKMQLTYCNSVYCGVVKSFLPKTIDGVTITAEMAEQAFKTKNGVA